MFPSGCHDCDRLTSGRCWRHSVTVIPVGHVTIIPATTTVPIILPTLTPYEFPDTVPR